MTIDTKSLRRGNLLQVSSGDYTLFQSKIGAVVSLSEGVVALEFPDVEYEFRRNGFLASEISPIPLTEETLKAMGFLWSETDEDWFHHDMRGAIEFWDNKWWWTPEGEAITVNSVHQLQNLFHATTGGQELTYTPEKV